MELNAFKPAVVNIIPLYDAFSSSVIVANAALRSFTTSRKSRCFPSESYADTPSSSNALAALSVGAYKSDIARLKYVPATEP